MADIEFSKEQRQMLVSKVSAYVQKELDHELGQFDAEFLLDFFIHEIGPYFYNQGIHDSQALLEKKMEAFTDSLYEIEKPTEI